MKENIAITVAFVIGVTLFAWVAVVGLDKNDEARCHELLQQSKDFPAFFLTEQEKEMCDYQGIEINAQVK